MQTKEMFEQSYRLGPSTPRVSKFMKRFLLFTCGQPLAIGDLISHFDSLAEAVCHVIDEDTVATGSHWYIVDTASMKIAQKGVKP